jgi:LPS sulfotransferase NodH
VAVLFPALPDNPHLRALERHFPTLTVAPGDLPAGVRFVFLCYTNRCGSNHLADMLHSDGRLNRAAEVFNADQVLASARVFGQVRFGEHVRLQALRWSNTGLFLVKAAVPHIELLGRAGVLDLVAGSARYIHATRADRLAQAVSHDIAIQTGQWTSLETARAAPPSYDRARLDGIIASIAHEEALFERFFATNAIVPVRVTYEDFIADPHPAMEAIGAAIGLAGLRAVPAAMQFARQSGPLNAAWHARYRAGD